MLVYITSSIRHGKADTLDDRLRSYAECMAGGTHTCNRLRLRLRLELEAESFLVPELIYQVLGAFANFATLPFVIQFHTVKHKVKQAIQKLNTKSTNVSFL